MEHGARNLFVCMDRWYMRPKNVRLPITWREITGKQGIKSRGWLKARRRTKKTWGALVWQWQQRRIKVAAQTKYQADSPSHALNYLYTLETHFFCLNILDKTNSRKKTRASSSVYGCGHFASAVIFSKTCTDLQTQHAQPCLCCHLCCTSARLSPCLHEGAGRKQTCCSSSPPSHHCLQIMLNVLMHQL